MIIGDRVLHRGSDSISGVPIDRLIYVTGWSNSHFDTTSLTMGKRGLFLNVAVPRELCKNDDNAAYVLVELIDGLVAA